MNRLSRRDVIEARLREFLEVERKRWTWNLEQFADLSGRIALGTAIDQQAKNGEPRLLRQRRERPNHRLMLHIFKSIEL